MDNRLDAIEFGRRLLETEDLDPLYVSLYKANMGRNHLCRWLVNYWCWYHAGLCSWASEQDERTVMPSIAVGVYPRGTERRHFRGRLAVEAVSRLWSTFSTAEGMIDWLLEAGPRADSIMNRVKSLYGFGEWICWKIPDMLDRLELGKVTFVNRDVDLMLPSVQKGALEVAERYSPGPDPLMRAHKYLLRHLGKRKAPPSYDRGLNVQETETIFCKWKSHLNGHYPIGKDTHEIREGLLKYDCKTSRKLLENLPHA